MPDHSHYDYERSITSLQSTVSSLDRRLTNLRSDTTTVKRNVSNLSSRAAGLESSLRQLEAQIGELHRYLSEYEGQIRDMASSLKATHDALATLGEQVADESEREKEHRGQITKQLQSLASLQGKLAQILQSGLDDTMSHLATLREKEDGFRKMFLQAGEEFKRLMQDMGYRLHSQITGIEEDIVALEDDERDSAERTLDVLRDIQKRQKNLGESFVAMTRSTAQLAEHADKLVLCEETIRPWMAKHEAVSANAAGLKLLASGQAGSAFKEFRRAAKMVPDQLAPRFNLAVALMELGDYEQASGFVGELLAKCPDHAEVRFLNGIIAIRCGRADEAVKAFQECLTQPQVDARVRHGLVLAHLQAGQPVPARRHLQRAARLARQASQIEQAVLLDLLTEIAENS